MTKLIQIAVVLIAGMVISACVTHRDTRSEIFNENTYLDKNFLTRANPNHTPTEGEEDDHGWLLGTSVTAMSVPAPINDIFPGLQGDIKYVHFQFSQSSLQIVDGITPGPYSDEEDAADPREAGDLAPRVMQEYTGGHVDIQLRKNLDGEVTNYVEEFRERDWQDRQFFKTELHNGAFADLARVYWYYNWAVSDAMQLKSASLVPGSMRYVDTVAEESNFCDGADDVCNVDWESGDYLEWTVRVTYAVDLNYTSSLMAMRTDVDTQTIDIKYSLWRRPDPPEGSEYIPRAIGEKDKYRRKFGIWDYTLHNYQDPDTGLIGSELYLSRYNPKMPINFYLVDVPAEFREHPENGDVYEHVANHTNDVFTLAGVDARIAFHETDEGGMIREFGDIRYSFVVWHNNEFTRIPWLGYGPSWVDPRTGEIINSTLNFNNYKGLHFYTYLAKDLLEQTSSIFDEGGQGGCTPGERRQIDEEIVKNRLHNSTLYSKMKSYMQQDPEDWVVKHDEEWYGYYHMLLEDLRYFYPPYQTFVYSPESHMKAMQETRKELMAKDLEFLELSSKFDSPKAPWGNDDFSSPAGMESMVEWNNKMKAAMNNHQEFEADRMIAAGVKGMCLSEGPLLLTSIADINQKCKSDGTWQTFEEWEDDIRWRIAHQISIHELGHDIGQYHNFYGSIDHLHYQPCTGCVGRETGPSSSVMDYVHHFAEVGADLGWYPYDKATLVYAYRYNSQEEVDQETDAALKALLHPEWVNGNPDEIDQSQTLLYANDYQAPLSPLVATFDLGTTPSEIVFNAIQYYDFMYKFNNFRSYRQYWETWNYPNRAFNATFPLRRMLEMWALDFSPVDIENDLRILGVDEDIHFFDNLADEFDKEMGQAARLTINFFRAVLNQSNGERSYATTYDSYFGDVTRLGIIYDKLYAMFSFLGLWPADMYNWDLYALLAYYDGNFGDPFLYSDALDTVTVMLGGSYDVYPWFLPNAVMLFAQDTHNISFGDQGMKEWIGMRSFARLGDMIDYFGFDPRTQCMNSDGTIENDCSTAAFGAEDDGHQAFYDAEGNQWVYLFMYDQNKHICASIDHSPISSKMLWDYNEDVNINKYTSASTYNIKFFLDFYEYFESPFGF